MSSNTRVYLAALALFALGIGWLVCSGLKEGSAYHLDVAEALGMPHEKLQNVRVFGVVAAEGMEKSPNALGARFLLRDQNDPSVVMEVVYSGAVPDGFKDGAEVYAEGSLQPGSKALAAHGLTASCPSKYQKENRK